MNNIQQNHIKKRKNFLVLIIMVLVMILNGHVFASNNLLQQEVENFSEELNFNDIISTLQEFTEDVDLTGVAQGLISGDSNALSGFGSLVVNILGENLFSVIKQMISLLVFIVIMAIAKAMELDEKSQISKVANIICILVVTTIFISSYIEICDTVVNAVRREGQIVQILSPLLMCALMITGAITTTSLIEPIILLLVGIVTTVITNLVMPIISLSLVFNIISSLSESLKFNKLSKFLNSIGLGVIAVIFTLFLGLTELQTSITTSVDSVTVDVSQAAVSNFIPVVGKFVSDSVEYIFGAVGIIGKTRTE